MFTVHGRRLCELDLWKQSEQLELESTGSYVAVGQIDKQLWYQIEDVLCRRL